MMSDPLHPGVIARVRAVWHGERSAVALEAMRRAGKDAYSELLRADRLREEALASGTLWAAPPALGSQLLAGWNAFVLQTLSEALLDTDYHEAPGTIGFVPPATFEQAWAWLSAVQSWLSRSEQARRNPDCDLTSELALPAALPDWVRVMPYEHLTAMTAAIPAIRTNAEIALFALQRPNVPAAGQRAVNRLGQLAAEACAAGDYATALHTGVRDERLDELVGDSLRRAIEIWFDVGQLAAIPALLETYRPRPAGVRPDPEMLPGGRSFDPWCLTDSRARKVWQADPAAQQAIQTLWAKDPDPAATLALHAAIEAAVARGDLARIRTSDGGFCYYCCPWASLYEVRRPLWLAGHDLKVLRQFTLDIAGASEPFRRGLVFGPFEQTDEVGYYGSTEGSARDRQPPAGPPRRRRSRRRR
jgi:hypothetical protein